MIPLWDVRRRLQAFPQNGETKHTGNARQQGQVTDDTWQEQGIEDKPSQAAMQAIEGKHTNVSEPNKGYRQARLGISKDIRGQASRRCKTDLRGQLGNPQQAGIEGIQNQV